ncbi:MAG: hypothetical protein K6D02_01455 [Lachnospiraceae bacterium]|nr:hypothetical protein [Lachnospiraceae bacterium]
MDRIFLDRRQLKMRKKSKNKFVNRLIVFLIICSFVVPSFGEKKAKAKNYNVEGKFIYAINMQYSDDEIMSTFDEKYTDAMSLITAFLDDYFENRGMEKDEAMYVGFSDVSVWSVRYENSDYIAYLGEVTGISDYNFYASIVDSKVDRSFGCHNNEETIMENYLYDKTKNELTAPTQAKYNEYLAEIEAAANSEEKEAVNKKYDDWLNENFEFPELIALSTTAKIPIGYTPIYTAEDLNNIRDNLTGKYILMNDIDMSAVSNPVTGIYSTNNSGWAPIGWYKKGCDSFGGIFDGNNHSIKGLTMSKPFIVDNTGYMGLFAKASNATIKNLKMEDVNYYGVATSASVYGGGLFGDSNGICQVKNCSVTGDIKPATDDDKGFMVGGVAGKLYKGSTVECCYSGVNIIATGAKTVTSGIGGLIGEACGSKDSIVNIKNCYYSNGALEVNSGNSDYAGVGGIIGIIDDYCRIFKNYANDYSTEGNNYYNNPIVGKLGVIKTGIVALSDLIYNNYTNLTKMQTGVTNLTDDEALLADSYKAFDFNNIWIMDSESDYKYPVLAEMNQEFEDTLYCNLTILEKAAFIEKVAIPNIVYYNNVLKYYSDELKEKEFKRIFFEKYVPYLINLTDDYCFKCIEGAGSDEDAVSSLNEYYKKSSDYFDGVTDELVNIEKAVINAEPNYIGNYDFRSFYDGYRKYARDYKNGYDYLKNGIVADSSTEESQIYTRRVVDAVIYDNHCYDEISKFREKTDDLINDYKYGDENTRLEAEETLETIYEDYVDSDEEVSVDYSIIRGVEPRDVDELKSIYSSSYKKFSNLSTTEKRRYIKYYSIPIIIMDELDKKYIGSEDLINDFVDEFVDDNWEEIQNYYENEYYSISKYVKSEEVINAFNDYYVNETSDDIKERWKNPELRRKESTPYYNYFNDKERNQYYYLENTFFANGNRKYISVDNDNVETINLLNLTTKGDLCNYNYDEWEAVEYLIGKLYLTEKQYTVKEEEFNEKISSLEGEELDSYMDEVFLKGVSVSKMDDQNITVNESPSPSPSVSPSASPSVSPSVSPSLNPSKSPVVSTSPVVSESPKVSASPDVSESPKVSASPVVSESPDVTPSPNISASPDVTPSPNISTSPAETTSPTTSSEPLVDEIHITNIRAYDNKNERAILSWSIVENGKEGIVSGNMFAIFRAEKKNGNYKKIKTVTNLNYVDKTIKPNKNYFYKVRELSTGNYSDIIKVNVKYKKPTVKIKKKRFGKIKYFSINFKKWSGNKVVIKVKNKKGKYKKIKLKDNKIKKKKHTFNLIYKEKNSTMSFQFFTGKGKYLSNCTSKKIKV